MEFIFGSQKQEKKISPIQKQKSDVKRSVIKLDIEITGYERRKQKSMIELKNMCKKNSKKELVNLKAREIVNFDSTIFKLEKSKLQLTSLELKLSEKQSSEEILKSLKSYNKIMKGINKRNNVQSIFKITK